MDAFLGKLPMDFLGTFLRLLTNCDDSFFDPDGRLKGLCF